MRKFIWLLLCILFIVDIAWFSIMQYERMQRSKERARLSTSFPENIELGIDYGKFCLQYEEHFRSLDEVYKEMDNLLNALWEDEGISFPEKYHILSARDRLEMIAVVLNYLWFDECSLYQKKIYFRAPSLKMFVDSNYGHKLRILLEIIESQIENIPGALSASSRTQMTTILRKVDKTLKETKDFLLHVKAVYKIED